MSKSFRLHLLTEALTQCNQLHVSVNLVSLCDTHLLAADDEKASAGKRRSAFKLLTDLLLVGVYQDAAVVVNAVKALASVDFVRDKEAAQTAVSLLASFAKSGRQDVLGLSSSKLSALSVEDNDEVTAVLSM